MSSQVFCEMSIQLKLLFPEDKWEICFPFIESFLTFFCPVLPVFALRHLFQLIALMTYFELVFEYKTWGDGSKTPWDVKSANN